MTAVEIISLFDSLQSFDQRVNLSGGLTQYWEIHKAQKSGTIQLTNPTEQSFNETIAKLEQFPPADLGSDVQAWFSTAKTKEAFKTIANSIVQYKHYNRDLPSGVSVQLSIAWKTLTSTYPESAATTADQTIKRILAALCNVHEMLPQADQPPTRQVLSALAPISRDLSAIVDSITPAQEVIAILSQQAIAALSPLIQVRHFLNTNELLTRFKALIVRIESGDLRQASDESKARVLAWAVRIAVQIDLEFAKKTFTELVNKYPGYPAQIPEALIHNASGNYQGGIDILLAQETSDARSVLLALLKERKGPTEALRWLESNPDYQGVHFLSPMGWLITTIMLWDVGRWNDAHATVTRISPAHSAEFPDLYLYEALACIALLFPESYREYVLNQPASNVKNHILEGPDCTLFRTRARFCLSEAENRLEGLCASRAALARHYRIWLDLMDTEAAVSNQAKTELSKRMATPEDGVRLIVFAKNFELEFDRNNLRNYLELRALLGELKPDELKADLALRQLELPPQEFIDYLELEENRYLSAYPREHLTATRLDLYLMLGQVDKARKLALERESDLRADDHERLAVAIQEANGIDPLQPLEQLYKRTNYLSDLENIINYLIPKNNHRAAIPFLQELYERARNLENLKRLVRSMILIDPFNAEDCLTLFTSAQDLVERDYELMTVKCRCLLEVGSLNEARIILATLLEEAPNSTTIQLGIELYAQEWSWSKLTTLVERATQILPELPSTLLLRLASIAATQGDRAVSLIRAAAKKADDDPNSLLTSYFLASKLGFEFEATPWLQSALKHSKSVGVIKAVSVAEFANEIIPKERAFQSKQDQRIRRGEMPLHMTSGLAELMLCVPSNSLLEPDYRRKALVPIVSPARINYSIHYASQLGLDLTTIYTLHWLGILKEVVASEIQIIVAAEAPILLFEAKAKCGVQLRIVEEAELLMELSGKGRIQALEIKRSSKQGLASAVGEEIAAHLEIADKFHGVVVTTFPIFKTVTHSLGSDELAKAGTLRSRLFSCRDFLKYLLKCGMISLSEINLADHALATQGDCLHEDAGLSVSASWFLLTPDAVSSLWEVNLLERIASLPIQLAVSSNCAKHAASVLSANRKQRLLSKQLSEIAEILEQGYANNKVRFAKRRSGGKKKEINLELMAVIQLLEDAGPGSFTAIDDRFFNKGLYFENRQKEQSPVLCTIDILNTLEIKGIVSREQRFQALHRLREAGFVFVAPTAEELMQLLLGHLKQSDFSTESTEMRVIRQALSRYFCEGMLCKGETEPFAQLILTVCVEVLEALWRADSQLELPQTVAPTKWLLRYLVSPVICNVCTSPAALSSLLSPLMAIGPKKLPESDIYNRLVDIYCVRPFVANNPAFGIDVVRSLLAINREIAQSFGDSEEQELAEKYLHSHLPYSLLGFIAELEPQMARKRNFEVIIAEAVKLFLRPDDSVGAPPENPSVRLRRCGDMIYISERDQAEVSLDGIAILSPEVDSRTAAVMKALEDIGPAAPDLRNLIEVANVRPLNEEEAILLLGELWNGVASFRKKLRNEIRPLPLLGLSFLMPESIRYFEFSYGHRWPFSPASFFDEIMEFRRNLASRELRSGVETCLLGTIDQRLLPGPLFADHLSDSLWEAVVACQPLLDPFSAIGTLDIALRRVEDERFASLARDILDAFSERRGPFNSECIERLLALTRSCLCHIQLIHYGSISSPVWKRMVALMHANFLSRLPIVAKIGVSELANFVHQESLFEGTLACDLDLWSDPLLPALEFLENQILLLCHKVIYLHFESASAIMGKSIGEDLHLPVPGLLEFTNRPLPAPTQGLEAETAFSDIQKFQWLNISGRFYLYSDAEVGFVAKFITDLRHSDGDLFDLLSMLFRTAEVTACQGNRLLVDTVADAILGRASEADESSILLLIRILLISAAAIREPVDRFEWIDNCLFELARRLPSGEPIRQCHLALERLQSLIPIESNFCRRALSLALAGVATP